MALRDFSASVALFLKFGVGAPVFSKPLCKKQKWFSIYVHIYDQQSHVEKECMMVHDNDACTGWGLSRPPKFSGGKRESCLEQSAQKIQVCADKSVVHMCVLPF